MQPIIGIGLRRPHIEEFLTKAPNIDWVEVHSENYISRGGPGFDALMAIRARYPVSMHGIGLSLGSSEGIKLEYLSALKAMVKEVAPFLISDHLSWSNINNYYLPDLLPAPYNKESLQIFINNINKAQEYLNRTILFENPSTYFEYHNSDHDEPDFMNILARSTGAGILLDVNNIYTSGLNNGWDSKKYISAIDRDLVKEIHISGHSIKQIDNTESILYIDSHDDRVADPVWELYQYAIQRFGVKPTLLEWDNNIPTLEALVEEAKIAEKYLTKQTVSVDD